MTTRIPADHATHDLELIAAHAAGDADAAGAARAMALLAGCPECRTVAADLAALRAVTRALPPIPRERDFRIPAETAARLRPASPIRRLVGGLLAPRGFGRPLAGALMTIGVAGLMVASLPTWLPGAASISTTGSERDGVAPLSGGSNGDSSAPDYVGPSAAPGGAQKDGVTGSPAPNGSQVPAVHPEPAPSASPPAGAGAAASPGAGPGTPPTDASTGGPESDDGRPAGGNDLALLGIGSGLLLAAGVILLVLRRVVAAASRRPGG